MSEAGSIQSNIRSFVFREFPIAKKRAITDDSPLLGSGIIDSLGTLSVVTFLEQTFLIKVSDEDLTPGNFGTIKCIASYVEKKRGPSEASRQ